MVRCSLSAPYSQVRSNGVTHHSEGQSAWCPGQGDYVTVWHIGIQLLPSARWHSCHKEQPPGQAVEPLASPGLMGLSQSPLCLWPKELEKRMLAPLFSFETQLPIFIATRGPTSVSVAGAYCYLIYLRVWPTPTMGTILWLTSMLTMSVLNPYHQAFKELYSAQCLQLGYGNLHH